MKVILLAGGFGTRLAEYTNVIPKPMVPIGGKPILWHIMQRYARYGHKDFFVALGYKAEVVKEYFLHYRSLNADFTVDLASGAISPLQQDPVDWRVTLVNTGDASMTGGRVKRLQKFIGNEPCMLTYGDGLADIAIEEVAIHLEAHASFGSKSRIPAVLNGFADQQGEAVGSGAAKLVGYTLGSRSTRCREWLRLQIQRRRHRELLRALRKCGPVLRAEELL